MNGLIAAFACVLVLALGTWVDEDRRKESALQQVERVCGERASQSYDIQGQSRIVYACAPDYRMRTLEYGHNWLWWVP